jgi:hypothetical protein
MKHRVAQLLSLSASAAFLASCSGADVTLATLPVSEEGGTALRCEDVADCPAGLYCEKPSCDAPSGVCEPFPIECGDDEQPVCGCDGITYFDDCLRTQNGIAASTAGSCHLEGASTCAGSMNALCPDGTVCALLLGTNSSCASFPEGSCWVLPARCPSPDASADTWDPCQAGQMGQGQHCLDTCTAIRMGGVYKRASMCH